VPSDEDEDVKAPIIRSATRTTRRRNTDFTGSALRSTFTPSPPPSPTLGLGFREQDHVVDKLKKENWDLKHRIALQQERAKKLETDLESALDRLKQSETLFQKNAALEKENNRLKFKLSVAQEVNDNLTKELEQLSDEVLEELDQKDREIHDRQLAIEEAAGMIQSLEIANQGLKQSLQQQQGANIQPDSDYFSGDQDTVPPLPAKATEPLPLTPAADSDYFSADGSPILTPKTPKRVAAVEPADDTRREKARLSAISFNRELGLRSITSKDSLFGNFLESSVQAANLPEKALKRTLRRRCSKDVTPTQEFKTPLATVNATLWSTSRPLRELYKAGDLGRQVDTPEKAVPPRPLTPSTASMITVNDAESDIFSRGGTSRPSSPTTTINTTLSDVPESPCLSSLLNDSVFSLARTETGRSRSATVTPTPSAPGGFNYEKWPRKLPEWPPSGSLHHRGAMFDGAGVNEMATPTPKATAPTRKSPTSIKTDSVPPRGSSLRVSSGKYGQSSPHLT
jgi:Centrosomin N-terminal motif 1